jgi:hypothetical protein
MRCWFRWGRGRLRDCVRARSNGHLSCNRLSPMVEDGHHDEDIAAAAIDKRIRKYPEHDVEARIR